ncbi:hypothetical protein Syun_003408 [Stephania yunnanensis]|uniref:Uncharacterized protein n=1 Tax=Stephania yunnanensis TaxID=152371 RepID=A0AAP0Q3V5_9MAGN
MRESGLVGYLRRGGEGANQERRTRGGADGLVERERVGECVMRGGDFFRAWRGTWWYVERGVVWHFGGPVVRRERRGDGHGGGGGIYYAGRGGRSNAAAEEKEGRHSGEVEVGERGGFHLGFNRVLHIRENDK